ncbi:MAG: hypothetical protein R3F61_11885 [Myxococcota bacterium]
MRIQTLGLAALVLVGGCDFSGDFLFPGAIDDVPGVLHLTAEDGGFMIPAVITTPEEAQAATVYVEFGPTGDANPSGLTLNFEGTGGSVCIFTDPELIYWNQAVSTQGGAATARWRFPDNPYDDGDIDLTAGLSVYYTGTEGEEIGNFAVQYQDSLGNTVPINLVSCTITANVLGGFNPTAHSGRGAVEYCTIANTQPGVSYTVALEVFSLPPDDNRLSIGLLLADGNCPSLINAAAPPEVTAVDGIHEECLIRGEAIPAFEDASGQVPQSIVSDDKGGTDGVRELPEGLTYRKGQLYYGYQEGRSWPGSEEFEDWFCSGEPIRGYCNEEKAMKSDAGVVCNYATPFSLDEKCYCGDQRDTPTGGAF